MTQTLPSLLIVDDERQFLDVTSSALKKHFDIRFATSVDEAMPLVQKYSFDVAMVDYSMSGTVGTILLQRLSSIAPKTLRLLMTANQDAQIVREAVRLGEIHGFIPKPIEMRSLIKEILEKLAQRSQKAVEDEMQSFLASEFLPGIALADQGMATQLIGASAGTEGSPYESSASAKPSPANLSLAMSILDEMQRDMLGSARHGAPLMRCELSQIDTTIQQVIEAFNLVFPNRVAAFAQKDIPYVYHSPPFFRRALWGVVFSALTASKEQNPVEISVKDSNAFFLTVLVKICRPDLVPKFKSWLAESWFAPEAGAATVLLRGADAILRAHGGSLWVNSLGKTFDDMAEEVEKPGAFEIALDFPRTDEQKAAFKATNAQ